MASLKFVEIRQEGLRFAGSVVRIAVNLEPAPEDTLSAGWWYLAAIPDLMEHELSGVFTLGSPVSSPPTGLAEPAGAPVTLHAVG